MCLGSETHLFLLRCVVSGTSFGFADTVNISSWSRAHACVLINSDERVKSGKQKVNAPVHRFT